MKTVDVGCAIIIRDRMLLIAQRKPDDTYGGLWEFPGGKREENETIEECLIREVEEELGIRIAPRTFLCVRDHPAGERLIRLFFYHCDWEAGEPKALDCHDWKWVAADEIGSHEFPKQDGAVLKELVECGLLKKTG